MMTPKERTTMQQALEALEYLPEMRGIEEAITALREALGNSLKRKCFADYQPNHAIDRACASCPVAAECQTGEQAEQEPVGYFAYDEEHDIWEELTGPNATGATPLYAAPVRTKDLMDDEIFKTNKTELPDCQDLVDFARAVIAADREKNK